MTFDPDAIEQRQRGRLAEIGGVRHVEAEADLTATLAAYRERVHHYHGRVLRQRARIAELEVEVERLRAKKGTYSRSNVKVIEEVFDERDQAIAQAARLAEAGEKMWNQRSNWEAWTNIEGDAWEAADGLRRALADYQRTQQEAER